MKALRLILIALGILATLAAVAAGVVFSGWFQTWAARVALASDPSLHGSVGSVSAGTSLVHVSDLHLEKSGVILSVPGLDVDLPWLNSVLSRSVEAEHLVAHGWTLDLTRLPLAETGTAGAQGSTTTEEAVAGAFAGLFERLDIPFDASVEGVDLEGKVLLPHNPDYRSGVAEVTIKGGGLGVGRVGDFDFEVSVTLEGSTRPVQSLRVAGKVSAEMASPRAFRALGARITATAFGKPFDKGISVSVQADATRALGGESYTIVLSGATKQLASIHADFPENTHHLSGTWSVDLRDKDIEPFVLGRTLPSIEAVGQGSFDTDASFTSLRAQGRLSGSASRLEVVKPELEALGRLSFDTEFDVAAGGDSLQVDRLVASLEGEHPVAQIEALQSFRYDLKSGELQVADPNADLVGLVIKAVPVSWVSPFVPGLVLSGEPIHGEFALHAGAGGLAARAKAPLSVSNLAIARGGKTLVSALDAEAYLSAVWSPQGWQVQLSPLRVRGIGVNLLSVDARAGRLAGNDQKLTAAAHWELSLAALASQPFVGARVALKGGLAKGDITLVSGPKRAIQTTLEVTQLAVDAAGTGSVLPDLSADIRADVDGGGLVSFRIPLTATRRGSVSDLLVAGSVQGLGSTPTFDVALSSNRLVLEDIQALSAILSPPANAASAAQVAASGPSKDVLSVWAPFQGKAKVSLREIHPRKGDPAASLDLSFQSTPGSLSVERMKATLGDASGVSASGVVAFDASSPKPYALTGEFSATNVPTASFLASASSSKPPAVDGRFDATGSVSGRSESLDTLARNLQGDLLVTSKAGVFNALAVDVAVKLQDSGRIANAVASIGSLASALTGRKDASDIASKAQAVSEFCKMLSPIRYDQLSVSITRGADLNLVLKSLSLISPDLRLSGSGQVTHDDLKALADQPLSLKLTLSARGRSGDLLKKAAVLDQKADDLGYTPCTIPFVVGGTLGRPDTTELQLALAKAAIEKSDILGRLLGR